MVKIRTRSLRDAQRSLGSADSSAGVAAVAATTPESAGSANDGDGQSSSIGDGGGYTASETAPEGPTPILEEVDSLQLIDLTTDEEDDAASPPPPKRSGWPKGKPRGPRGDRSAEYKRAYARKRSRSIGDIFGEEPPSQKLDRKLAGVILTIVEGMAVPQLGEHARFEPDERRLIEPSLANILERMTPQSAKMFSQFADPLMLGTGLLIWATRVFSAPKQPRPAPRLIRNGPPYVAQQEQPTAAASSPAPGEIMDGQPSADLSADWSATV